jgi:hypothetical protein
MRTFGNVRSERLRGTLRNSKLGHSYQRSRTLNSPGVDIYTRQSVCAPIGKALTSPISILSCLAKVDQPRRYQAT